MGLSGKLESTNSYCRLDQFWHCPVGGDELGMTNHPTRGSQCIRIASESVVENGLRPINERQASSLSAPDYFDTSCIEELSRFDLAAAHGYQPDSVVWGDRASGQLCCLPEGFLVRC